MRVQRVGRGDEEDVGDVEGQVEVVVAEGDVLLGVQDLQEGGGGVALVGGAQLVDLVDHEHGVLRLHDLQALDDLARAWRRRRCAGGP